MFGSEKSLQTEQIILLDACPCLHRDKLYAGMTIVSLESFEALAGHSRESGNP
jgi:hypothetical protein